MPGTFWRACPGGAEAMAGAAPTRRDWIVGTASAALVVAAVVALIHPSTAARLHFADPTPQDVVAMVETLRQQGPLSGFSTGKTWVPVPDGAEVQPGPCLRQTLSRGGRGQPTAVGVAFTCAARVDHPAEGALDLVVERIDWRNWPAGAADPRHFQPGLRALPPIEARAALERMGRG